MNEHNNANPLAPFNINFLKHYSSIFNLRQEIIDELKNTFIKWVEHSYGFKYYQDNFEIGDLDKFDEFVKNLKVSYLGIEDFLYDNMGDNFYENYISFKLDENSNIKLYNRETSPAILHFVTFYIKPCMIVKPTKYIKKKNSNDIKISAHKCSIYLSSFFRKT